MVKGSNNVALWIAAHALAPHATMSKHQNLYLRDWRRYRGLTQEKLAERAGVTQGMISHLENGRTDYSGHILTALAEALNCEPVDLLTRNPSDKAGVWSITDSLKKASPEQRAMIANVIDAFLKTGS
jgi:transcriptional regulator with XRE-family HTH domain